MKKLFFFKSSSTSSNGTDKQIRRDKESSAKNSLKNQFMKSQSEESNGVQALRRSRSFSSAAFFGDGNDKINGNGSSQHRQRNHSSRCFTPDTQCKKGEYSHMFKEHGSSRSLSTCSSNVSSHVLDRYIDGEEHLERSKQQKSGSLRSNLSGSSKGKRVTSRVQSPSSLSDYTRLKDASPRALARSVVERLSHTHGKSKALSSYEPMRNQDVYGGYNGKTLDSSLDVFSNLPLDEPVNDNYTEDHTEHQELFLHGKNKHIGGTNYVCKEENVDSELERKYKEAEKRVKVLSEELKEQEFLSECDFDIRRMEEERLALAIEVLNLLRSQMVEKDSLREEIDRAKTDRDFHIKRLEKEKSEIEIELEKELDRRSSEWTSKLESFQHEEKRLRERVRELAEHNVSLQRDVSSFHEKETERIDMLRHMEETVEELSATTEEMREENMYLMQNLSKLQEGYTDSTEDLGRVRRDFEDKDVECKELNKSVTNLLRTCKEQEKTIQGLRDSLSEETKKQPYETHEEMCKKLQMEQIRLTGVEFSLRKEIESVKLEADSLRRENTFLMNQVKGEEADTMNVKLDSEMNMRVYHLQDQGISMLNESTQLCYKFLKFIKEKLAKFPESYQDMKSMNNGLSEQFLIESEMSVHGIRRGTESLKRSLQTVTGLLLEKSNEMASESSSASADRLSSHFEVESLRAELRAEILITRLLKETLYSKEQNIEQLQAEVAAGVRGNEVLQCEIRNTLDKLSINAHHMKDFKLQMVKKDENINRLETNLQEAGKDSDNMRVTLTKVLEERENLWNQVCECRERNKDLESEKEMLKKKVEKLEEDTLFKEGQITILKDTLGSKHFDLFSSPEFSYNDFLVQ
ncbi:unnamed protein product [Cochlearia groenlandica]